VLYACNGSAAEKWSIVFNSQSGPSTAYVLWDFKNPVSGRCLREPNASNKPGTQLTLGGCDTATTSGGDWSRYSGRRVPPPLRWVGDGRARDGE
jgi:hypothetical protein